MTTARPDARAALLGALCLATAACAPVPADVPVPDRTPAPAVAALERDPGADRGAAYLFDDDAPVRTYRIEVAPERWEWLKAHATEETWVPAKVHFEGRTWPDAAVRYKGSYGTLYSCFDLQGNRTCPKLSLKVSLNEYDRKGRFFGLRKLIFNACHRDPSYLRERLAYALFRDAGLPAPRAVHARVQVNDEPAALFLLVEDIDAEFLQDRFADPTGALYKEAWPESTDPGRYVQALEDPADAPAASRLVAWASLLRTLSPGTFNAAIDAWIDRDAMTRYLAVDLFANDWDGITRFYCGAQATGRSGCGNHNFYLYDNPATGRFVVIPWDQDNSFSAPEADLGRSWWDTGEDACKVRVVGEWMGILPAQCDALLRGLMLDNWDAWVARLGAWSAEGALLHPASVQARLDRYRAQILDDVARDAAGPSPPEWRKAAARLREIVAAQALEVQALLAWTPPSPGP